jgi:cell division protein ZipA
MEKLDRETVRLILLAAGIVIIAGIYIWGRYGRKIVDYLNRSPEFDELEFEKSPGSEPEPAPAPSGGGAPPAAGRKTAAARDEVDEEFERLAAQRKVQPREAPLFADLDEDAVQPGGKPAAAPPPPPKKEAPRAMPLGAPFLIQFSVVAPDGYVFQGADLRDALMDLNLIHGAMDIFHRYDRDYREPVFSVANLVKPGTFPIDEMELFECPGVVLFFQPAQVADPVAVFDDLVETTQALAERLGGIAWDDAREPITPRKVAQTRILLQKACERL